MHDAQRKSCPSNIELYNVSGSLLCICILFSNPHEISDNLIAINPKLANYFLRRQSIVSRGAWGMFSHSVPSTRAVSWIKREPVPIPFFLHGHGVFDFRDLVSRTFDASVSERAWGSATQDGTVMMHYSMDAAIAPHLYRHPLRVHSPREKLHVLPLAPSTIPSRDIRWARMASVAHQLLVHSQHWADPSKVFALIASGDHFEDDFGPMLAATLRNRSNVVIAVVDRDMGNMRVNHPYRSLYANAVSIPYLAPRHLLHHCRTVAGNREDRARHGVMFHGDTGKYDSGARAAVRDIMSLVRAGSDFVSSYAAKGDVLQLQALQAHTRARMPSSALCFAPRGDNPSSGRFFEALATGCVPIIVGHDLSWMPFGELVVCKPYDR